MEKAHERDLTTTINIGALRSVSDHLSSLLDRATENERDVIAALPHGSAMLIVLSGPSRGACFLINSDVTTIGRSTDNDIFLDDVTVSRRHAEIKRTPAGFEVRDLGSMNGTFVGGHSVISQLLQDGEEIQIGKFRLTYFSGSNGSDL